MPNESEIASDARTAREAPVRCEDGLGRKRWGKDADIAALKACIRALNKSTSRKMLRANLGFLFDRYVVHPSAELPEHLRPNGKVSDDAS